MRLIAAILVLAFTVFTTSAGMAAPTHTECEHQAAIPGSGHGDHGVPAAPTEADFTCCMLHCFAVVEAVAGTLIPMFVPAAFQRANEHSMGRDIEPNIPPPRG